MTEKEVIVALYKEKSLKRAKISAKYFKTGIGQYGYGDIFIGVTVPAQRKIAKKFKDLPLHEVSKLLHSKIHECRFTALLILTYKSIDKEIYDFYLSHIKYINNWDLVDVSAGKIVGAYLFDKNKNILEILSRSVSLWERRISIVATEYFIKKKQIETTLIISEKLIQDHHDLIHKAVGWMLREVGKKNKKALHDFINAHVESMPRTMLRYAIEHFSQDERDVVMSR